MLGTIGMYRETSFFSTREASKGGDKRVRVHDPAVRLRPD